MKLSVVGLGKLGLCTAACFSSKGHEVYGFDNNVELLRELRAERCPIDEPGLLELLTAARPRFFVTDRLSHAIISSDVTFIIVPTPSKPDGRFSNKFVINALEAMAPTIREKKKFHIINIVSTVMPGSIETVFKPLVESLTGKTCGQDFGLTYNPEFIALGSVIRDFLHPDMVLIGASDKRSGEAIKSIYETTCQSKPHIALMSLINAEITKISLNCYVTMKISFANSLAFVCERISGADVDAVTTAIGADTRVGSKYIRGGLGFGGPCFPRDNIAFQALASDIGADTDLGVAVVEINKTVIRRLFEKITSARTGGKIALFGISYKPGTHIIEDSQSLSLAAQLSAAGYDVTISDPKALPEAESVLGDSVDYQKIAYDCAREAAVLVLLTDWPEYRELDWAKVSKLAADDAVVIDSWRIVPVEERSRFKYIALGIGAEEAKRG